jgi:hypothetical protein
MDYELAKLWFDILQTLLIAAIGVMNWLNNRHRITTATITKLEESLDGRLDSQTARLIRVEQDMKHAPGDDDFKRLYQRLDVLNGEFKELRGEFHSMRSTLALIHQYLMDRK